MNKKRSLLFPLILIALLSAWGGDFFAAVSPENFLSAGIGRKCSCRSYPADESPVSGGELSFGNELPGTVVAFRSSRRSDDFLRNFRPRNNDVPELPGKLVDVCRRYGNVFVLPYAVFSFQNFLQKSLPPRAGPLAV